MKSLKDRKVLLTGATGFVGRNLVKELCHEQAEVCVLVRATSNLVSLENFKVKVKVISNCDESILEAFREFEPEVVIHAATNYSHETDFNGVRDMLETNITFGALTLKAMEKVGLKKIVNISSNAEFSFDGKNSPNSLYSTSKRAFRDLVEYHQRCLSYQVFNLVLYDNYGPYDTRGKVLSLLKKASVSPLPIKMSAGEQLLNLVYVQDTVNGIMLATKKLLAVNQQENFNDFACLRSITFHSLQEVALEYEQVLGRKLNIVWGALPYRKNEIMKPWPGPILPMWKPQVNLSEGLILMESINKSAKNES